MDSFYRELDKKEQEDRIARIVNNRPADLHNYQGCANDEANMSKHDKHKFRRSGFNGLCNFLNTAGEYCREEEGHYCHISTKPAIGSQFEYLTYAQIGLDKLDRIYSYLNNATEGDIRFESMRLIIKAQSHWRASIANHIHGTVMLPAKGWNLTIEDFPPQVRLFFHGQTR